MAVSEEFKAFVVELLEPLGPVAPRRMFGGVGLFLDGGMFALIADDVLYLKGDDHNRAALEAMGTGPFKPFDQKPMIMPYWEVPGDLLEDPESLCGLARGSWEAARRAARKKSRKKAG